MGEKSEEKTNSRCSLKDLTSVIGLEALKKSSMGMICSRKGIKLGPIESADPTWMKRREECYFLDAFVISDKKKGGGERLPI